MHVELVAEITSREDFAKASHGWLNSILKEVFPGLYEGLLTRPVTRQKARAKSDLDAPWGQPHHVLGTLTTYLKHPVLNGREALYSDAAWSRAMEDLNDYPFGVSLEITELDREGFPKQRGGSTIAVNRDFYHPEWVSFTFSASAADTGWPDSVQVQDQWAASVQRQAAQTNTCAGGMTDDIGPGQTALQRMTLNLSADIADSKQVLRGYTWITILDGQLSARLGGLSRLQSSGAFCDVKELPNGSVWLRATPTINEFTGNKIRKVFEVLAPVLLTGLAKARFAAESYRAVEDVDAADYKRP